MEAARRSRPLRRMWVPRRIAATTCAATICLAACGDDAVELPPAEPAPSSTVTTDPRPATDAPSATTDEPGPTATTTAATVTTTPPASTTTAPTTEPATTTTSTTVAEVAPTTGWTAVDPASLSPKALPPCCADNWHGAASPPLTPAGEPLADGPYFVATAWPADVTQPLEPELFRFDHCELLPQPACEQNGVEYGFDPDELGVDTSASRSMTLPLDPSVRVVVVGWDTASGSAGFVVEAATGAELAALAVEVERAYADVFADRFASGEDPDQIVDDVLVNPTGGFGPGHGSLGAIAFTPTAGPPLLFQSVFPYVDGHANVGRGTDVLTINAIEVVDGRTTLFVYAAYYP